MSVQLRVVCPECGKEVPLEDRFCGGCGSPMPEVKVVEKKGKPISSPVQEQRPPVADRQAALLATLPLTTGQRVERCQRCGSIDATYPVEFGRVIGLIFFRHYKSIGGEFCPRCVEQVYSDYQTTNWILGWWGIIAWAINISYIIRNGKMRREARDYFAMVAAR